MQEDFLITLKGTMQQEDDIEHVELTTRGRFLVKNHIFYIIYKESEATGYEGCVTTLKVEDNKVSIIRHGRLSSHLVVEKGLRHVCHYDTGFGALNLGVCADFIEHTLTQEGGSLRLSYFLDMDLRNISCNTLEITVHPIT